MGGSASMGALGVGGPGNASSAMNVGAHAKGRGGLLYGAIPLSSHADIVAQGN